MFITKKKLEEIKEAEYTKGVQRGYDLGWHLATINANNYLAQYGLRLQWQTAPQIVVTDQIDEILKEEDF